MIFLSAGRKYQDITVSIRSSNGGNISLTELPVAICENIAPDMAKKKPAKAHSFSKANLRISHATPAVSHEPSILKRSDKFLEKKILISVRGQESGFGDEFLERAIPCSWRRPTATKCYPADVQSKSTITRSPSLAVKWLLTAEKCL